MKEKQVTVTATLKDVIAEFQALSFPNRTQLDRIYYLRDRWQDEKEFEDFKDYKTAVINCLEQMEVKAVTKAFTVTGIYKGVQVTYKFSASGRVSLQYKK